MALETAQVSQLPDCLIQTCSCLLQCARVLKLPYRALAPAGRLIWTLNLHHFAWVTIGLPGSRVTQANGYAENVPSRMVKFLLPPGAIWGITAGCPVKVKINGPSGGWRSAAQFEMGEHEWSRNLMHGIVAADTLDAKVGYGTLG
jgi:hypothetical protein